MMGEEEPEGGGGEEADSIIIGPSGNHTARLQRVALNLDGLIDDPDHYRPAITALSRIGVFARCLAADVADGAVDAADVASLLLGLAEQGDRCLYGEFKTTTSEIAALPATADRPTLSLRRSLCEPPSAVFAAAERLTAAAEFHRIGDHVAAEQALREADDPAVRAYTDWGWGKGAAARYGFLQPADAPAYLPKDLRPTPRMPTITTRLQVLARDGPHCRFCGTPVIPPAVRARFQKAYPRVVGWGMTNASQHAAFQCMWLQYDHLLPNSRGGDSSAANIVVTCAVCNFGRMQATLAEAQLIDPLLHPTPQVWEGFKSWRGLESFEAASPFADSGQLRSGPVDVRGAL